jgi:hypothetical protein
MAVVIAAGLGAFLLDTGHQTKAIGADVVLDGLRRLDMESLQSVVIRWRRFGQDNLSDAVLGLQHNDLEGAQGLLGVDQRNTGKGPAEELAVLCRAVLVVRVHVRDAED